LHSIHANHANQPLISPRFSSEMPLDVRKIDEEQQRHLMAAQDAAR